MRTALVAFFFLAAAGCAAVGGGSASPLAGTTWVVERVVHADGSVVRGGGETLAFGADGSVAIASCNQCSGRYTVAGDVLRLAEPLACTRRACPAGTLELERVVAGERRVRRDGEYLVIEGGPAEPDAPKVLLLPG